jgi:hypothetical protein
MCRSMRSQRWSALAATPTMMMMTATNTRHMATDSWSCPRCRPQTRLRATDAACAAHRERAPAAFRSAGRRTSRAERRRARRGRPPAHCIRQVIWSWRKAIQPVDGHLTCNAIPRLQMQTAAAAASKVFEANQMRMQTKARRADLLWSISSQGSYFLCLRSQWKIRSFLLPSKLVDGAELSDSSS